MKAALRAGRFGQSPYRGYPSPLVASFSGRASRILGDGRVAQDQEILTLDNEVVAKKLMAVRANVRASSDLAIDLKALISFGSTIGPVRLLTETVKAELAHFLNLLRENRFFPY
ncbi:hypothetical protein [Rhizobium laguerreae]|uniref:hypothetical protein n=1 Tax=Rhizobium laguerreae TaxID=1076926 RepID=UPI001C926F20|nr:hypothetical protein [Rhizobium laguerreae]